MFSIRTIFKHYWQEARKHKTLMVVAFSAFGIAIFISDIVEPLVFRGIIDAISGASDPSQVAPALFRLVGILALVILIENIFFRIGDFTLIPFETRSSRDLTNYVFGQMETHSYSFFTNQFVGSITAKVRRFINAFERMLEIFLFRFVFSFIRIVGVLMVLLIIHPTLGLIFLAWVVLYGFVIVIRIRPQMRYDLAAAHADSLVTARFADALTNILNVKMFSSEHREATLFADVTDHQERKQQQAGKFALISMGIQGGMLGILEITGMVAAIIFWLEGSISTGTVVLVQSYILILFGGLLGVGQQIVRFFQSLADAQEMVDILEEKRGIQDPENPESLEVSGGRIEFKNTGFLYEEGTNHVFKKFSLVIESGQKIGLVGPSGSGKSTITKLLLRFVDLQEGSIAIDGKDIRNILQQDLRNAIAYVPQDPLLFHRTLKENIAYAKPETSDEEIFEAASRARIHNFISGLPKGYETLVGERGVKLSGGERQRVAIARAILKNAPILVLDEATSSLDTISELAVKEALRELMKGKTALVIAHRLSTVRELDRILVLNEGRIVEEGNHEELVMRGGLYAKLWAHQTEIPWASKRVGKKRK